MFSKITRARVKGPRCFLARLWLFLREFLARLWACIQGDTYFYVNKRKDDDKNG